MTDGPEIPESDKIVRRVRTDDGCPDLADRGLVADSPHSDRKRPHLSAIEGQGIAGLDVDRCEGVRDRRRDPSLILCLVADLAIKNSKERGEWIRFIPPHELDDFRRDPPSAKCRRAHSPQVHESVPMLTDHEGV